MNTQQKSKKGTAFKLLVGFFILLGLIATLGHYFAPRPVATASPIAFLPVGPEWFLEQLPRYDLLPITTFLHLAPAALFMVLLGFQLSKAFREKSPKQHRIAGYVLSALALTFTIAGFVLGLKIPFGGNIEVVTSSMVAIIFLYTLYKGVRYAREKNVTQHRIWMLRMVAVSFTPLTMRLIMIPAGFMQIVEMQSIFGSLMIISSVINLLILEKFILKKSHKINPQHNKLQTTGVSN